MDKEIRVRFAPSPTGPLHIGGARSALFNWLLARKEGGKMIVRVEDTDLDRSTRESEELILNNLRWLGMDWDEGIEVGGENGPYRQSERLDIYKPYVDNLLKEGKAYYCFCSEEDLEKEREEFKEKGQVPMYNGRCLSLTQGEIDEYLSQGQEPVVRFKVPAGGQVVINDMVRGKVTFENDGIGDYIIVKSDGFPTYNFACVLDDILMKITHIVRGEEHLSNTPRQVLLYDALEVPPPNFAHISLILGEDRSKMSKRHGATSIRQYQEKGYLPGALLNYLALLGWAPEGEEEFFSLEELIQAFSLDRVSKSPAVFSLEKLNWINAHYLKLASVEKITEMALPYLKDAGYIDDVLSTTEKDWLKQVVASFQVKLEYVSQVTTHATVYFDDTKEPENQEAADIINNSTEVIKELLERIDSISPWEEDSIKKELKSIGKDLKVKGKGLFMPARVAVSGQTWGPELPTLIKLLGKERVKKRISHFLTKV